MASVEKWRIDSTEYSDDRDGEHFSLGFTVYNLSSQTGEEQLREAVDLPEIPKRFDPHPLFPGTICTSRTAKLLDDGTVKIICKFNIPDQSEETVFKSSFGSGGAESGTASVSTASRQVDTNFDRHGNPLIVTYTGEVEDDDGNPVEVENEEQLATVSIFRSETVVRFDRVEDSSGLAFSRTFKDTINARGIGAYAAGTLLCNRIDSTTRDGGETYDVVYEFQVNEDGWNRQPVSFIDEKTDRPPVDAKIGNGITLFEFYEPRDFSLLGLRWPR